ncbi:Usually multiple acids move in and out Transporters 21 [Hibiscus trionum]|uniref:WAT1-related protein n=1 Tax=Hibiscus trionum TaxID=183268 RepID=A0A9W7H389_HIBTR|nr:Usually multiple acids move in and out Transporters 21 [Hibiscus trionum]
MEKKKPYLAVILIQSIYAGMFLVSKAAFDGGMNNFVLVFYRQAAATVLLVPLALFLEWRTAPPLSLVTFCKIFMLSLIGITLSLDINGMALVYTSATLAAAITNCLPVITFFIAVLLRMEALRLKTIVGIAKLVGILICLAGALTLAFYKGPHFKLFCLHQLFDHQHSRTPPSRTSSGDETWIKGCLLMLLSSTFWGLWLVLQGLVLKSYPSKLLFTALQCLLSTFQSFAIAIGVERDPYQWRLGWNLRLLAVAYCGIVVTGVTYYLQAWVIEAKGPVFLAMSTPLTFILTILCSALLLCQVITAGSLLGGLLLIIGLYSVLWGKTREQRMMDGENTNSLPAHHVDQGCTELKVAAAS